MRERIPDFDARTETARQEVRDEIIAYERGLAGVRRARERTQAEVARSLGIPQSQVSRLEHQADAYLSTLRKYINGLGGELELVAVFDDTQIVFDLPGLAEEPEPAPAV